MTDSFKVDATGAEGASLADNVASLNDRQREAFGGDLSLSPQTPQAQWSGIAGLALTEMGEALARAALYGSSVDHAEGVHLDAIGSVADVRRLEATRSRVAVDLDGVAGTVVPAGSRAKTSANDEFETEAEVELGNAPVRTVMIALEAGPVEAAAGALNRVVTAVEGWETVTNPDSAVVGRARQDDEAYRRTYRARTAHAGTASPDALEAALVEVGGDHVVVRHNPTSAAVIVQGWRISQHSILVLVRGGSDTDVWRAVENRRGMGVGTVSAIVGGPPPSGGFGSTPPRLTWNGAEYALDLTGAADNAARAAALSAVLPANVHVAWTGAVFAVQFDWAPDATPAFGDGATERAFGLDPNSAIAPSGPFVRPLVRRFGLALTLVRRPGFPSDGLDRIKAGMVRVADSYSVGAEPWIGDFRSEAERVGGTRITDARLTVGGAEASGVLPDLATLWELRAEDVAITLG